MNERTYCILDLDDRVLASGMTFEMALVFVKGYKDQFYNERLILTIKEEIHETIMLDE